MLSEGEIETERLRDEQGCERHIDVGAVEIERISGRHHETYHRLGTAEPFELLHEGGKRAFRRRCAQHDQQFILDVGKEFEDRETDNSGDDAKHHDHEERCREIERRDEADQIKDGPRAEFADGEGHRAKSADRRRLHHDGDDAENPMRRIVDEGTQGVTAFAKAHEGKAEQDRKQQHLQDLATCEGADHRVGDDVKKEVDALLGLGLLGVIGHRLRIGHRAAKAHARAHQVSDGEPDNQCESRDDLEIDQRLDADPPDLLEVAGAGDTVHDNAEHDRRNDHRNQFQEGVAEDLQADGKFGRGHSQHNSQ
ncbi:hypothetical protein GALL_511450 [mine drainage metagenome]|uniref:Uncharacterized protein n=1 Tax=mine drainage metagenome TaxID=410659 RepID=A0A1J5PUR4_9ZZZZ